MQIEKSILEHDIAVVCVTAKSYPEGISGAHEKLHALIPFSVDRKYFGISCPNEKGIIIYKAAAEVLQPEEINITDCESFTIQKGEYASIIVHNYPQHISNIKKAFDELLTHPNLDSVGYCLEWYLNQKDVKCMIRLASKHNN